MIGRIRSITGTEPAAAAEISETVPAGVIWEILSLSLQLVTDASVANRQVELEMDDGTTVFFQGGANASHAASLTRRYTASGASQPRTETTALGNFLLAIPRGIELPAGHRIRTSTANLQMGDSFSAPQLLVRERPL